MAKRTRTPKKHPVEGLMSFIDSQAQVMLAQYNNINELLGITHDYTHPGTLCENLIKACVRNFLPQSFSVDKGYVFGHSESTQRHCPEIDLLIHDVHNYSPYYRMQDFVIVRPEAVRAIIQVKRDLDTGDQLVEGVANVIHARQFVNEQLGVPDMSLFSAVVSMRGSLPKDRLLRAFHKNKILASRRIEPAAEQMPQFIGSLSGEMARLNGPYEFHVAKSQVDLPECRTHNVALPWLLHRTLSSFLNDAPSFYTRVAPETCYVLNLVSERG